MSHQELTPDLETAQRFLDQLDPNGNFTFQTFDDKKPVGGQRARHGLARIFHGHLVSHAKELKQLQSHGAGVFVMVNEGDLKGRSKQNVKRVRAHFLDLDGSPLDPVMASALPPHIVVESSPGKWHTYWLIDDCPLDEFKERQQALASKYSGDHAVCD
jgi:hypothetical protein